MAREGRTRRRHAILGLVIVVHALLVALALRHQETTSVVQNNASLIFLTSPAPLPPPSAALPTQSNEAPSATASSKRTERSAGDFSISLDAQATPLSGELPLRLGVDWDNEGSTVANSQAASLFKELKHLCDEAAKRGDQPPPGCRKYREPPPWEPEPNKFGLTDGPGLRLPFVRLGKRCILGLGFFGCGVGKLPEANGHVLDDFRDPDRPRSSVPDPNDRPD
jgi:hypothetical protein